MSLHIHQAGMLVPPLVLTVLVASTARGQSPIHVFDGSTEERQGFSIAGGGDFDGDGVPDVVVGAPSDDDPVANVRVFSGATGSLIRELAGPWGFGMSLDVMPDLDGDDVPELIVGNGEDDTAGGKAGAVRLYSGRTGELLQEVLGEHDFGGEPMEFGERVASAGDVDADGYADWIAGARFSAAVHSGRSGARLLTLRGTYDIFWSFATAVDGVGDVDGDGHDDVIVGTFTDDTVFEDSGKAVVYSGRTGDRLFDFVGPSEHAYLGSVVAGAGDVDADGVPDFLVGAPFAEEDGADMGSAYVYSGRTGGLILNFHADLASGILEGLGRAVAPAGDVDRDGFDDVIVGAVGEEGGAWIFSGRNGSILHSVTESAAAFGYAVAGAGDIDGDGFPEWIVGAPGNFLDGDAGRVFVYSARVPIARRCSPAVAIRPEQAARSMRWATPPYSRTTSASRPRTSRLGKSPGCSVRAAETTSREHSEARALCAWAE